MIRSALKNDVHNRETWDTAKWETVLRDSPSLEVLFNSLDSFADLPNGVSRLRELVLELAVRGKTVPQDHDDEPAQIAVARIKTQQSRLVESKAIRKPKRTCPIKEVPFPVPTGWAWTRLGDITFVITDGVHKTPTYVSEGVPFLSIKDISSGRLDFSSTRFVTRAAHEKMIARCHPERGDILFTRIGTLGTNVVVDCDAEFSIFVSVGLIKYPQNEIDSGFLSCLMNSPPLHRQYQEIKAGGSHTDKLNLGDMPQLLIPLPPLTEQRRIVEKVESLMSLCDELESLRKERGSVRERAGRSVLVSLTSAPVKKTGKSKETLASAWQRLSDHFEILLDQPENLDHLRQSILQLAVQGKLVRQDPNDESVGELVEAAASGRTKIVNDYRLRSAAKFDAIAVEEEPFQLPDGWRWCRMGEFGAFMGGGTPSKGNSEYWSGKIPWVTPKDMKRPLIEDAIDHVSKEGIDNSSAKMIPSESVLMVVRGMILVHSFPVAISKRKLTINQDMKALVLGDKRLAKYLLLLGQGSRDRVLSLVKRSSHGTCRLATEDLESFVVGLPPLAEQSRIVEKVASLLLRCEMLSTQLQNQRSALDSLLTALVHQILEDAK